ncbi:uncharacterized protein LOC127798485 isoform X2 [Diospyros lotus]|uniref:uncharacterized protein LOC127798485 isoform X2 n=1 Tax=Diospyros lotus TaxID=55363 RepID=UPI0022587A24|nr:uncharacterized protein LOC127798485 isoform X2 [Diospyros lotus]
MEMDGPLDFEAEDRLLNLKSPAPAKRRKLIGLDDLLKDHLQENKTLEMKSKRAKARKNDYSDDDEDDREVKLSECVEKCQREMGQISGEDEVLSWGLQVFGNQKSWPVLVFNELGSCGILQSFMENELNSLVELDIDKGETFLKNLLVNGWLLKLVFARGHVEKLIATWTFDLMLYSLEEALSSSACDFWTAILSFKTKGDLLHIKIDWLPKYFELKRALEIYGFLMDLPSKFPSDVEVVNVDSDCRGPSRHIRAWIKFITACTQVRSTYSILSTSEAEELLVVIICLFVDRRVLGLSVILYKCMLSVINFFTDTEWNTSSEKVARSLVCRIPGDVNCMRIVESISGVDERSKHLRCIVAFHLLVSCLDEKVSDAEGILKLLISINVKDRSCDLLKLYIFLVLTENWLLYTPALDGKPVVLEMWGVFLRNCSCQITSTDLRCYASKVRSKASYLLQGTNNK